MKALRWHAREDIRVDDIPIPQPGKDEVLLKVMYSGICGSEFHEYQAGPIFIPMDPHPLTGTNAPQTMGHEFSGSVAALGSDVEGLQLDTIVAVNPILSCGKCPSCRRGRENLCEQLAYYGLIGNGGHAEYAVIRAANCLPVPVGMPAEYAAFAEPAGTAYHAVNQARLQPGSSVCVLGGGSIGQLVAQYAREAGAAKVYMSEIISSRIDLAREIGAVDEVFNPLEQDVVEAILAETEGQGVDCAIECCGGSKTGMLEDTAFEAVGMTRAEGVTVIVGTFAEPTEFHFNNIVLMERQIIGSWVWHTTEEYNEALQLIGSGKVQIEPLISAKININDALAEGIQLSSLEKDNYLKILIDLT